MLEQGAEERPSDVSFDKQVASYIEAEFLQGYGLDQIKDCLLSLGYDTARIDRAVSEVAQKHKVTDAQRTRAPERTHDGHVKRKFHTPIAAILLVTFMLAAVFYFLDTEKKPTESATEAPKTLYDRLALNPNEYEITSSRILYSRTENIDVARTARIITENQGNAHFKGLASKEGIVKDIQKTVTSYRVFNKKRNAIEELTYVSIGFSPAIDQDAIKVVELIPKSSIPNAKDIRLPRGGIIVESDPIIAWKFSDVKKDEPVRVAYIITKKISGLSTNTLVTSVTPGVETPGETSCGNNICEVGESYFTCCGDCGCLPNFFCVQNECLTGVNECETDKDCDDHDPSTKGFCQGKPKECAYVKITECVTGDEYCPPSCAQQNDKDCKPPAPQAPSKAIAEEGPFKPEFTSDCGDLECFEDNFAGCIESSLIVKSTRTTTTYYVIIGPKLTLCQVKIKVTAHANHDLVGKEMVCNYDTKKKFMQAIQDMNTCSGPLLNALRFPPVV
ncbi:hypothetical protein HY772_07480 [Candidatus Woesearchaeota archaeon]|nr:hypothetical protein [Candidatus Woesearchaeota archaeon]